ncbi:mutT/NUDIX family protein [Yersinia ruckeri]|nr:mutT/NUDIX family protein [Yersinia ruckeri]
MLREGVKHFTTSVIILDENDRILMHFHKKLPLWLYLAGHIEENFFARKLQKKRGDGIGTWI